ncbi:MAG: spore maturation protein, partial [Pseudoflavonifractor sp.]
MDLALSMLMPGIMAAVAICGLARRVDVYDGLVTGAGEGLGLLIKIVPSMIALLTAVYMLRASGALDLAAQALGPLLRFFGIPPETVALLLVRPISGGGALGVG